MARGLSYCSSAPPTSGHPEPLCYGSLGAEYPPRGFQNSLWKADSSDPPIMMDSVWGLGICIF